MNKYTELRKLPADYLSSVEDILQTNDDWKKLMNLIPKNLQNLVNQEYELKYNSEHISLIENYADDNRVKYAKVLFSEWSTSGQNRPTLETLQILLVKAEMFRAADAIANMLGEPLPQRPSFGPAAPIDINITRVLNEDSQTQQLNSTTQDHCNKTTEQMKSFNLMTFPTTEVLNPQDSASAEEMYLPDSAILNPKPTYDSTQIPLAPTGESETQSNSNIELTLSQYTSRTSNAIDHSDVLFQESNFIILFSYNELDLITNNFTTHIGNGRFGDVFLGNHGGLGLLAVKKANAQISKQSLAKVTDIFNNAVKPLSTLNHINIVTIFGYSLDGTTPCIVCEYIEGGTLKQKIDDKILNESQRINIMNGTAEGLRYIHNYVKPGSDPVKEHFIHGDVKSTNILLTKDYNPKLCDFGLAKQIDILTESFGSKTAYTAPESSEIQTQKSDIYSYGMVLLELLTGLDPADENKEIMNIKEYLQENSVDDISRLVLDKVVDIWYNAQSLYCIAKLCLNFEYTERPSMDEICSGFNIIKGRM